MGLLEKYLYDPVENRLMCQMEDEVSRRLEMYKREGRVPLDALLSQSLGLCKGYRMPEELVKRLVSREELRS